VQQTAAGFDPKPPFVEMSSCKCISYNLLLATVVQSRNNCGPRIAERPVVTCPSPGCVEDASSPVLVDQKTNLCEFLHPSRCPAASMVIPTRTGGHMKSIAIHTALLTGLLFLLVRLLHQRLTRRMATVSFIDHTLFEECFARCIAAISFIDHTFGRGRERRRDRSHEHDDCEAGRRCQS
jgi:hypothetical protein